MNIGNTPYQVCTNCVMDTTDSAIKFDSDGVCDHCKDFIHNTRAGWLEDQHSHQKIFTLIESIRKSGVNHDFDCILGLSGGLDSSYLLHCLVTAYGLRPLVFHVDGGWNSDVATSNIQKLVDKLGLDLFTEVIDWEDMQDFQLAFLKSGISQLDIPQDHAFVATLYKFAHKHGIKYIINGGNISTECVRNPLEWLYYGTDMRLIDDIRRKFCSRPLHNYPFSSVYFHKFYLRHLRGVKVVRPLDLIEYSRADAIATLEKIYGWRPYQQKHFESRFTKFFEGYWLPTRFGYDTRRVQFSSLILTGQMSRDQALENLASPPYDPETIEDDFSYIAKKLCISQEELREYHIMPLKSYRDYKNQESIFNFGARVLKAAGLERSIKR